MFFSCLSAFESSIEAYEYLLRKVIEHGDPLESHNCIEIIGQGARIENPRPERELLHRGDVPVEWAEREFYQRVSGQRVNPGDAWREWPEFWEGKLTPSGKFHYTYAERWASQLNPLVERLREKPSIRRAMLMTYLPADTTERGRVPCSVTMQFFVRAGALCCFSYLRSSDAVNLLPADLYHYCQLLRWMSKQTGRDVGSLAVLLGSLHVFDRDMVKARGRLGDS